MPTPSRRTVPYSAAYYKANADSIKAYREANADSIKAYSAKYRAVQQAIRRAHNALRIILNPVLSKRGLLSETDAKTCANSLLLAPRPEFDGMSIFQAVESKKYLVYVGTTKQLLCMEDLRWLTARGFHVAEGKTYLGGRNRPVLQWRVTNQDGDDELTPIKMKYSR